MTLGHVSALMDVQEDVRDRLEWGSSGSLGGMFDLGDGLNLSATRRALGNIVANALDGSSLQSAGASPFTGYYMTPPVGSPGIAVCAANSNETAEVSALVAEYRRLLPDLTEAEMKEYLRRVETEGKVAAMQWVVRTKRAGQ